MAGPCLPGSAFHLELLLQADLLLYGFAVPRAPVPRQCNKVSKRRQAFDFVPWGVSLMSEPFLDRVLRCADCHADFIFTAGEQVFFFDKQFKNDPKRCKPCKSRRSGLAAAAANGLSVPVKTAIQTETRTQCSDCGVETTVPFKPTQGRPVLCRQCFGRKQPTRSPGITAEIAAQAAVLTMVSTEPGKPCLSHDAGVLAVTSMVGAKVHSSVASEMDLAYVVSLGAVEERQTGGPAGTSTYIPDDALDRLPVQAESLLG